MNFAPGETVKTVRVTMSNGSIAEAIENFELIYSQPAPMQPLLMPRHWGQLSIMTRPPARRLSRSTTLSWMKPARKLLLSLPGSPIHQRGFDELRHAKWHSRGWHRFCG
ncbi:MAG: hypothetical protein IPO71_07380 [Nitrosomonas sp.]|nr:hypothetical protein [Nitrosomonas sp.]